MAESQCAVCGKVVAASDQPEHLRTNHLGPHYFWFSAQRFRTREPSLTMAEIKKLAGCSPEYCVYEEREGGDIPRGDGESADLTREPHFWAAPPATIWG